MVAYYGGKIKISTQEPPRNDIADCSGPKWEFPKIRGTLFGGPYKDPTIQGAILGSPIFGNYQIPN